MRKSPIWLWIMTGVSTIIATSFWITTIKQPLIDAYEFRQTQTALSALFMQPGLTGLLEYHTPVLGSPWSIPFEFPLFQWISHHLANLTGLNLSTNGRLLSILFGIACIWPAKRLMKRAGLGNISIALFVTLYFTSSIYLYWNRAFLMESMALFFTLSSLDIYDYIRLQNAPTIRQTYLLNIGLALTLSLALLVKATTALPALIIMGIDWVWQTPRASQNRHLLRKHIFIASALSAAFVLLYSWTHHADSIKQLNPIGSQLTSSALRSWNFGNLNQRIGGELWNGVVLQRMLLPSAAIPTIGLIAIGTLITKEKTRTFLLTSLALAFSPLLIFPNLHIIHQYYQAGNQIFLLMCVAGASEAIIKNRRFHPWGNFFTLSLISIIVIANLHNFSTLYLPISQLQRSNRTTIGNLIQKQTPTNSAIIVIGDDWSSAFAYHSKRRALTSPDWPVAKSRTAEALSSPQTVFGDHPLGAIISSQLIDVKQFASICTTKSEHKVGEWNVLICNN